MYIMCQFNKLELNINKLVPINEFVDTDYESDEEEEDEFICDKCGAELELVENTNWMCLDCDMEGFEMD